MSETDNDKKGEVLNANSNDLGKKSQNTSRIKKEEEEEEERCGICAFMKGGACKKEFTLWEKCRDEFEMGDEYLNKCNGLRTAMVNCMFANPVYHKPLLEPLAAMANRNDDQTDDQH